MTGSRGYTERLTFEVRDETGDVGVWEPKLYRMGKVDVDTLTFTLLADRELSALDPQTSRIVWRSPTGDVTINLISKTPKPSGSRRPEIVFGGSTEQFELNDKPKSLVDLNGNEAVYMT